MNKQLNVLYAASQAAAKAVLAMQQKPPDPPGAALASAPAPGQDREAALALSGEEAFARRAMCVPPHLTMLCMSHTSRDKHSVWIVTTPPICSCHLRQHSCFWSASLYHHVAVLMQEASLSTPQLCLHVTKNVSKQGCMPLWSNLPGNPCFHCRC